jgi:hypothetical protein
MFGALLLLAAAPARDPLAEARTGKVQCVTPNLETKKCLAIASYAARTDGSFDTLVRLMIAPSPLITVETHSVSSVEGDAVCSIVRKSDYEAAKYTVDGKPAEPAVSNAIGAQVLASVTALDGKKACSRDRAEGPLMIEEVTLDGVARPEMTQKFIWVKPGDGYTLGQ